jgi:hypothetical protein
MLGITVGLFAVVVQFWLAIELFTGQGASLAGAVVKYFSFFTILTNIFLVLVYCAHISGGRLAFFRLPRVVMSAVVAITVVGIVYHFLLADLWNPQGMMKLTDILLHYVAPAIMLLWWLGFGRAGTARRRDILFFLVYPLAYLGYVLIRAPIAGEVPYPFLDYRENGWSSVLQTTVAILILFIVVSALAVAADRFLPARTRQKPAP